MLRDFTRTDWMAFAGCEDKHPLIDDDHAETIVVVVDGKNLCINHYGGDQDEHGCVPCYAFEAPSRSDAMRVAEALVTLATCRQIGMPFGKTLEAYCGEEIAWV